MKLSKSIILADITAADSAIKDYENNHFSEMKGIAAFHLQQAAEKLIKIQIYSISPEDEDNLRTHNILRLVVYADSMLSGIYIPKYIREKAPRITMWEASGRYYADFTVRITSLKATLKTIKDWYNAV